MLDSLRIIEKTFQDVLKIQKHEVINNFKRQIPNLLINFAKMN